MLGEGLHFLLQAALGDCIAVEPDNLADLSGIRGAYALVLHVQEPVHFSRRRIAPTALSGWIVYAGSAHGGGGMGARLGRHFRRDKTVRWHIDELSSAADALMAFAIPDGRECDIVDRLLATGRFETALPGFGSSDCRRCAAHLLRPYRS
jgi:Uri superfamily endonuclease